MSRSQESQAFSTASGQNATLFGDATAGLNQSQEAIGDYQKALQQYSEAVSGYAAKNPYVQGGEFQTDIGRKLADTAEGTAEAERAGAQGQALRTGVNPGAAISAGESTARNAQRTLAGEQAGAEEQRIGSEAGYNQSALSAEEALTRASALPAELQEKLYGTTLGGSQTALGDETKAGETPSFGDILGQSLAQGVGSFLGKGFTGGGITVCYVAAELYGGWDDHRTQLIRSWLFTEFNRSLMGFVITTLYCFTGKPLAWLIHRNNLLRRGFKILFDAGLRRAEAWKRVR